MKKDELRDLCLQRELPVSGTNSELVARLRGWDDAHGGDEPDLLAEAGITQPPAEQSPEPLPPTPVPQPVAPVQTHEDPPPEGEAKANQTVFRTRFEVPGNPNAVIPTELHHQCMRSTEDAAVRSGYRVRGQASRIGFETDGGKRYAIYEVTLGRRVKEVR